MATCRVIPEGNQFFSVAAVSGFNAPEAVANAKLIAAAPELLAVLRVIATKCLNELIVTDPSETVDVAECLDRDGGDSFTISLTINEADAIAKAVAKADGRKL